MRAKSSAPATGLPGAFGQWPNCFRLGIFAGWLLGCCCLCRADGDTNTIIRPTPEQGSISSSGKFMASEMGAPIAKATPEMVAEFAADLQHSLQVESVGSNTFQIGKVLFDRQDRTVTVPAYVAIRNQLVEYALVTQRGKTYESLLATDASPLAIHLAFLLLGVTPGTVTGGLNQAESAAPTNTVQIAVRWETNGVPSQVDLTDWLKLVRFGPATNLPALMQTNWLYNGSELDNLGFAAGREGSIVALIRDSSALVNNIGPDRDNDHLHWPAEASLPPAGWAVQVIFHIGEPEPQPGTNSAPAIPITPLSTNQ
ncbi:MAG TPA: YdjY domain-containing protein [Dongiaceae bacterium]|nr:YdjY domain-containing protein [Dongiaceae bacterium]